jgi:two-component system, chemotaxis family, chemotaxis protein CheY
MVHSSKRIRGEFMKVLIVDDSEPMRRMINNFIADLASEIVECADGSEALGAYSEHRPDVILMDLQMNTMNGFEATKQIKDIYPLARIVIVSQWEDAGLLEAARKAGAEAYVGKSDLEPLRRILE